MRYLLCAVLVVLIGQSSLAQVPYFQHYQPVRRSPVSTQTILQDREGYLWFGTDNGLFRFDGYEFSRLTVDDSLADNRVTALAQDSTGRLWIGHANGLISVHHAGRTVPFEPEEGLSSRPVSSIQVDRKGVVWFSTLNDGLYYYRNNRLFRIDEQEGLPDLYVYDLEVLSDGRIAAGTDGGLVLITLNDSPVLQVLDQSNGLPDNIVRKIRADEQGNLWLATEDLGLVVVSEADLSVHSVLPEWRLGPIHDFLVKDNKVWMTTRNGGLAVLDTHKGVMKENTTQSVRGAEGVGPVYKDREGNIWIGSKTGILRTHGDHLQFIENFKSSDANILAVVMDKSGNLWYSNSEGLFKRSPHAGEPDQDERPLAGTRYSNYRVISLYEDRLGFIWAGLYGEGVIRIHPGTGQLQYLRKELNNGNVLSIAGDDRYVWLATLGGGTRIEYTATPMRVTNFTQKDGLVSDFIYQVFVDKKKRVWFGTDGKGAVMLDEKGFHHFEQVRGSNVVYGFAEDTHGNVWANIQGDVLYRYDGSRFSAMDSLPLRSDHIYGFTSDRVGNLMLFHESGIDVYDVVNNRM